MGFRINYMKINRQKPVTRCYWFESFRINYMKINPLHILLHFGIAAAGGIYVSIVCAVFGEAYDEWMLRRGKIGHYEGWSWQDFFEKSAGALILFPFVGWDGIFMPWWATKIFLLF
jgi:hypothetical protein